MIENFNYHRYIELCQKVRIAKYSENKNILSDFFLEIAYQKCKYSLKNVIFDLFFVPKLDNLKFAMTNSNIVFTDAHTRKDHVDLLSIIRDGISSSYVHLMLEGKKVYISFKHIFLAFIFVLKNRDLFSLKECFFLFKKVVYTFNVVDSLERLFKSTHIVSSKYVAFHSQYGLESILVPFFASKGIETYTLSHGLSYCKYRTEIPLDIVNAKNINTNYVIVWGKSSKDDLVSNYSLSEKQVLIGGNPKYPLKRLKIKQSFKSCIVLLGRRLYDDGNKEILKTLSKIKELEEIDFFVRLHPSLDVQEYRDLCGKYKFKFVETNESLQTSLASGIYDFAIVNNSTAYYEAMYYDLICFRFEKDENELYLGFDDKFRTELELLKKIAFFKEKDNEILNREVSNFLILTLGMGINNYEKYLS